MPLHSSTVQALPSSVQDVPIVSTPSAGHVVLEPVQVSARSHSPAEARQMAPAFPAVCRHVPVSSHSSREQGLPSSEHGVPLALLPSGGQTSSLPVHVSAASHSPADARHTVPAFPAGCVQLAPEPLHWSSVQGFPSLVHAEPFCSKASAGQLALEPVQLSARSHSPAEARQTVPALPTGCWHAAVVPSQMSRVQTLRSSVQEVPLALTASPGQVALVPV